MELKVKRLVPAAVLPKKAHATDAGFDLVAVSRTVDEDGAVVYGTGLAVEIPEGHVGMLFPRSSVAKYDIILSNCVGIIDSGYRGEVMAKFKLMDPLLKHDEYHWYGIGDRIAQLIIVELPDVEIVESEELSDSDRGTGGYGSSGR